MSTAPNDPITAVTHPDPYPYYARLTAEKPLYYDEVLRLWVASSAGSVTAVLTSELCRVRPAAEPVPRALAGSTAGKIFGALVRMNDGQNHCPLKQAVTSTLDTLDRQHVFEVSLHHAQALNAANLTDYAFQLPAYVVADLLGVSQKYFADVASWMRNFVRSLSPISSADQIE